MTSANAVIVSHGQSSIEGTSADGRKHLLGETQTVTVEGDFDNPEDLARSIEVLRELMDGTAPDRVSLVEITSENEPTPSAVLASVEAVVGAPAERTRKLSLSIGALSRLSALAKAAGFTVATKVRNGAVKAGQSAYAAVTDPYKITLMATRFVSASGAAYVGVQLASKLPMNVTSYINTLHATALTGVMSAGFVMFGDAYSDLIVNPGFFSRKVDDSPWLKSVYKKFHEKFRGEAPVTDELPVKLGLYADQFIKSLSLEFVFVYASTLATAGVSAANESLSHILTGVINGGIGQTFFDQSIAIWHRSRELAITEKYPEGPLRDVLLKRLERKRDLGMAVNSLAQVWMVMVSTRGNAFAGTALHLYVARRCYCPRRHDPVGKPPQQNRTIESGPRAHASACARTSNSLTRRAQPLRSALRLT